MFKETRHDTESPTARSPTTSSHSRLFGVLLVRGCAPLPCGQPPLAVLGARPTSTGPRAEAGWPSPAHPHRACVGRTHAVCACFHLPPLMFPKIHIRANFSAENMLYSDLCLCLEDQDAPQTNLITRSGYLSVGLRPRLPWIGRWFRYFEWCLLVAWRMAVTLRRSWTDNLSSHSRPEG